jgi:selT/selW/selH-like putative selenoprotein
LKQAFAADAKLIKGSGGIFDVRVDGAMVFSKHNVGRFPDPGEVVSLVKAAGQSSAGAKH